MSTSISIKDLYDIGGYPETELDDEKTETVKEEIVYKVVSTPDDGKLYSALYWEMEDEERTGVILEYKVGEWNRPVIPYSKLFVFKTVDEAVHYVDTTSQAVYKCRARGLTEGTPFVADYVRVPIVEDYWEAYHNDKLLEWRSHSVDDDFFYDILGSYFADEIILDERVF